MISRNLCLGIVLALIATGFLLAHRSYILVVLTHREAALFVCVLETQFMYIKTHISRNIEFLPKIESLKYITARVIHGSNSMYNIMSCSSLSHVSRAFISSCNEKSIKRTTVLSQLMVNKTRTVQEHRILI
jgi:hypothetical protein